MSFALQPGRATGPALPISPEEARVRVDLAAAYRLAALERWDDLIYTHISATVPGEPDQFLINPFGFAFDEIRASDLVKINGRGEVVGETVHPVNVTGFALHAAVHAARADAHCVMHLHNTAGIAVSAQAEGLLPLSQHAMRFYGRMAYHDYEGLAFTPAEGARLTTSLGGHPAMLLRNHGTLTVGRTVAEAYVLMATLIKACEIQLGAQLGSATVQPSAAVADKTSLQLFDNGAVEGVMEWPALLRRLDKIEPTYKD
ncbi:class II aldolase/adducin family protein [Cupriavidus pauculus]|uniref:Class II aldolase n=1 Tax=Cupriavidus pauculus TaxID=82633 RepID=A0A2N5CHD6_9BURK|nr:class II aldolase/adducin family protein [Cupriavidus pauculus]PLQ01656.1 class II aldolase [Cupriavidus pauculus]